jgi:hypothetical protein
MVVESDADLIQDFFADSPDMLFIAGIDGSLLRTSRALAEALGDVTGASIVERARPDDRARIEAEWAKLASSEGRGAIVFGWALDPGLGSGEAELRRLGPRDHGQERALRRRSARAFICLAALPWRAPF